MKRFATALVLAATTCVAAAAPVDMAGSSTAGQEPAGVLPIVGVWQVKADGAKKVVAVDGSRWKQGTPSPDLDGAAAAVFAAEGAAFAAAMKSHPSFPLAIAKDSPAMASGSVTVRFRPLAGKEDQAGGIAFAIRPNGDYLILRGNALEDNLILFQFKNGRRSTLKEVRNVPTKSNQWHELRLTVDGSRITGSLDGQRYLQHDLGRAATGRVGLWSKADSVVDFAELDVSSK